MSQSKKERKGIERDRDRQRDRQRERVTEREKGEKEGEGSTITILTFHCPAYYIKKKKKLI